MKYRVIKHFGSRSGLKIYWAGETVNFPKGSNRATRLIDCGYIAPLSYVNKLPKNIHDILQVWVDCNDNPIKQISIYCDEYCDSYPVDGDGFYCYSFFGYVDQHCSNQLAGKITLRLKNPLTFDYEPNKDYSLIELGLEEKK